MSSTPTPPVQCPHPRRLVWVGALRPSLKFQKLGCRKYPFEAHLWLAPFDPASTCPGRRRLGGSYVHYDLPVRLHACPSTGSGPRACRDGSPPRLAATQLARSSVLNRLSAPAGLSPALMCALRAHGISGIGLEENERREWEFREEMRGFVGIRARRARRTRRISGIV